MSVEDLAKQRPRLQGGIVEMLDQAAARARQEQAPETDDVPGFDKLTPLPQPGDPYALAFAVSRHHPVLMIRFLLADATNRGFPFANLDSLDWLHGEKPGDGPRIVARFDGMTPTEVVVAGRNLELLYDQLGHFKVIWARELPVQRDFRDKDLPETVVNKISFRPVEPVTR
jgi:hypothetical protein